MNDTNTQAGGPKRAHDEDGDRCPECDSLLEDVGWSCGDCRECAHCCRCGDEDEWPEGGAA